MSRPPEATMRFDFWSKAQVITQLDRSGMLIFFSVVCAFHTISLPSCDADTRCVESPDQCIA